MSIVPDATTCALVYGFAAAGEAATAALCRRGVRTLVADDQATDERAVLAAELGAEWLGAPDDAALAAALADADILVPAPGVPERHRLFAMAADAGVEVLSEVELAYRWEQQRPGGPRPMLAITGTDGKTTTTLMAVAMLRAAGLRAIDAGNTETPLVTALDQDLDAFVVECTSFRLAWTSTFAPQAAVWLNLAPDHLDWHDSLDSYIAAKAKIWAHQSADHVAIGFSADPIVSDHLSRAPATRRTFGLDEGDYRLDRDDTDGRENTDGGDDTDDTDVGSDAEVLIGPSGPIMRRSEMRRSLPHDVTNALAAAALVLETGLAQPEHVGAALAEFAGPPHRLEWLRQVDGVDWFNDSKATTPHAAAVAIAAFDRIVLIAGGYDKRVDLAPMAAHRSSIRATVALGATRERIGEMFADAGPVTLVDTLDEAVAEARRLATPGDVVLLSPGCASFGLYRNFEARGEHFRQLVGALADSTNTSQHANQPASQREI